MPELADKAGNAISPDELRNCVIHTVEGESLPFWRTPLVSPFSVEGRDLSWLKKAVSPSHLLPRDILPGAKSVVSFFIPFTGEVVLGNREGESDSEEWALCYIKTNELIAKIGIRLEKLFASAGFQTGTIPATHNFDEERLVSDWSHRHIARLAGLGSFGLNNMLITEKGCCGRFGSVVSEWDYPGPQPSPAEEKCLYRRKGTCGICVDRCSAGAYGKDTESPGNIHFNRKRCYERCLENAECYKALGLADVCGKCLTGLPCSLRAP
jgi:epoxyqueuosine reductase QueG